MAESDQNDETQQGTGIITEERVKKPSMYAVLVHNDPFTPRDFVVEVLRLFFQKSVTDAAKIMLTAHTSGHSVVAVYSLEVAETKVAQANSYSLEHNKLLLFSYEKA